MTLDKPKRHVDEELLDKYRRRSCEICGSFPSDPAHIKTVKSGAPDVDDNLLSLCRTHHAQQHSEGFFKMCEKYPFFRQTLAQKGWIFNGSKQLRRAEGYEFKFTQKSAGKL